MNHHLLYGVVLLSAVGHASWNALLKTTSDRLILMVAIRAVGLLYGVIVLWTVGAPSIESLGWVIATVAVMWIYQALLIQGYHMGDLSFVYPLSRGLAPVLLTVVAFLLLDESISVMQLLGVTSISLGIVTLSLLGRGNRDALIYAVMIGASIAGYSFLGSAGARLSGNVFGFSAMLEVTTGAGFLAYTAVARGRSSILALVAIWPMGLGAGLLSIVGYLTFLVAAIYLPIGPVSAIRECSALFGVLIGIFFMKEPFGVARIVGTLLMTSGIIALAVL